VSAVRFLAIAGLLLSGCFYLDPFVERPVITWQIVEPTLGAPHRGGTVRIMAQYETDRRPGTYAWSVFACDGYDGIRGTGCSTSPFDTSSADIWSFQVPTVVAGSGAPVQAVYVQLQARDDRGVPALGGIDWFPVADQRPTLELRKDAHTFTVGAPIELFAKYSDPDDGPEDVELTWRVFTPSTQPPYTLEDGQVGSVDEPGFRTVSKRFVADLAGEWNIAVTARDPLGEMVEVRLPVVVAEDRPPCLAQWQPITPPDGATLPVTDPTVFQVPQVSDDLDAHPQVTGDPVFGRPAFTWSILPPGATVREPLVGATGNSIDFDPRAFTPGDVVELRVEISDRNRTAIPCADSAPTCSVISQPACLQRLTWRVEVR
jgi:hypothetical protein